MTFLEQCFQDHNSTIVKINIDLVNRLVQIWNTNNTYSNLTFGGIEQKNNNKLKVGQCRDINIYLEIPIISSLLYFEFDRLTYNYHYFSPGSEYIEVDNSLIKIQRSIVHYSSVIPALIRKAKDIEKKKKHYAKLTTRSIKTAQQELKNFQDAIKPKTKK
jgi:hypothetical protein